MPVRRAASAPGTSTGPSDRSFALVARRQEQHRCLRPAVDQQDRARHLDAGQVVELVVLPELQRVAGLGRPLDDGDAVADLLHEPLARRAANSSFGSESVKSGWAAAPATLNSSAATTKTDLRMTGTPSNRRVWPDYMPAIVQSSRGMAAQLAWRRR